MAFLLGQQKSAVPLKQLTALAERSDDPFACLTWAVKHYICLAMNASVDQDSLNKCLHAIQLQIQDIPVLLATNSITSSDEWMIKTRFLQQGCLDPTVSALKVSVLLCLVRRNLQMMNHESFDCCLERIDG